MSTDLPSTPALDLEAAPVDQAEENSVEAGPTTLSKNAQKRLAKEARLARMKLERRAREKLMKKEKKKLKAEKRAAGEILSGPSDEPPNKKARLEKRQPFNARVVIDLGFDEMMHAKEISSLCSQLNFTYAENKKAQQPFSWLLYTSLNARTKAELDRIGNKAYLRWKGIDYWSSGYEALWNAKEPVVIAEDEIPHNTKGEQSKTASTLQQRARSHRAEKSTVVYLTADAEEELTELSEGETYIIGGIVDRNRYKNKAVAQGVRTARLPIGTYLASLPTRKVLTVNQVFSILLRWVEVRDWKEALMAVMPKRKFKDPNAKPLPTEDVPEDVEEVDGIASESEVDDKFETADEGEGDGAGLHQENVEESHQVI
ncbi:tRNA (guanine(9)-N(1))-methyltransferase [Tulasnella sp. 403]|nr:tRNA (guanine(9)-N(1))-methyltransferase [Tulasnella sp. 403]